MEIILYGRKRIGFRSKNHLEATLLHFLNKTISGTGTDNDTASFQRVRNLTFVMMEHKMFGQRHPLQLSDLASGFCFCFEDNPACTLADMTRNSSAIAAGHGNA